MSAAIEAVPEIRTVTVEPAPSFDPSSLRAETFAHLSDVLWNNQQYLGEKLKAHQTLEATQSRMDSLIAGFAGEIAESAAAGQGLIDSTVAAMRSEVTIADIRAVAADEDQGGKDAAWIMAVRQRMLNPEDAEIQTLQAELETELAMTPATRLRTLSYPSVGSFNRLVGTGPETPGDTHLRAVLEHKAKPTEADLRRLIERRLLVEAYTQAYAATFRPEVDEIMTTARRLTYDVTPKNYVTALNVVDRIYAYAPYHPEAAALRREIIAKRVNLLRMQVGKSLKKLEDTRDMSGAARFNRYSQIATDANSLYWTYREQVPAAIARQGDKAVDEYIFSRNPGLVATLKRVQDGLRNNWVAARQAVGYKDTDTSGYQPAHKYNFPAAA